MKTSEHEKRPPQTQQRQQQEQQKMTTAEKNTKKTQNYVYLYIDILEEKKADPTEKQLFKVWVFFREGVFLDPILAREHTSSQ